MLQGVWNDITVCSHIELQVTVWYNHRMGSRRSPFISSYRTQRSGTEQLISAAMEQQVSHILSSPHPSSSSYSFSPSQAHLQPQHWSLEK